MIEEATSEFPVIDNRMTLFVLNSSRTFGEEVSLRLAVGPGLHEEREFEDGEHKARPLISVRGKNAFVIQSLYADDQQSGNDKLCRLLFFIGALKDAAAARVQRSFRIWLMRARIGKPSRAIRSQRVMWQRCLRQWAPMRS